MHATRVITPLRARLLLIVSVLLVGQLADAARGAKPRLERAARLIEKELAYDEGVDLLRRLLRQSELDSANRPEAFRLLGIAYTARGNHDAAEAAFWELLRLQPDYQLDPLLSPKIHAVFDRVRSKVVAAPRLRELTASRAGSGLLFSVAVSDPSRRLATLALHYRFVDGPYASLPMRVEGSHADAALESAIDADGAESTRVQFFLVGHGENGATVARLAGAEAPATVIVERVTERIEVEAPQPWYRRWWVWAGAGAAVAIGVGVAATLATRGPDCSGPSGTLTPICLD